MVCLTSNCYRNVITMNCYPRQHLHDYQQQQPQHVLEKHLGLLVGSRPPTDDWASKAAPSTSIQHHLKHQRWKNAHNQISQIVHSIGYPLSSAQGDIKSGFPKGGQEISPTHRKFQRCQHGLKLKLWALGASWGVQIEVSDLDMKGRYFGTKIGIRFLFGVNC